MECRCPYCLSPVQSGAPCPACGRDWEGYQPASHHLPPGSLLQERYQLGRALGEGGFGITYLGWDTVLKRKVAVKEYFPTFLVSREVSLTLDVTCHTSGNQPTYEKGREQFLREAKTMARLDSIPEIVQVLDHFPEHNTAYIVMEFLEGRTLKEVVAQSGPIPADTMLALLEPVLRAMEAMHQAGVIHRDISPDNLMELKDGTVKLMDFGCARDFQSGLTETITLKHGFAPREQYSGRDQGPWTDVYALCATVYYCLTGKVPPRATLRGEEEQDPMIPPRQLGADLIEEQERALLRGLSPKVENRWHSAAELYAALYGRTLDGTPWTWSEEQIGQTEFVNTEENKGPTPDPIPKKPTIPAKWIKLGGAAACALVALAAVLALGLGSGGQENVLSDDSDRPQSTAGQNADQEDASQTPEEDPKPSGEDGQAGDGQLIPAISDQELEPEPAADPDQPDIEAGQTGIGGQTGSQTTPSQSTQPSQPEPPPQPEEPAVPTQGELEAQAETQANNGQYSLAAETLRQMEQLGYLTAAQLGTRLCGLADDALFDDENSIAAALYQESADLGNLDGKRGLAICYQYGSGVPQSDETAFALNLELAQANYGAGVYYKVADAYTDGRGTAQNPEQAIYWWNRYLETGSTTFIDPDKVRAKIAELEGTS